MRWILLLSLTFAITSTAQAIPAGWEQIRPGGETKCARGAEYSFLYHAGDPQKVVVSFGQGGACWDAASCAGSLLYKDTVDSNFQDVSEKGGVYDLDNPANPYFGWTQIMVPYCTADVHLGNGDATYQRGGRSFTIHHRGAINAKAVIGWMQAKHTELQNIVVSGCSAGSYGSIIWTPTLAEYYKTARITQYGDSGAGVADHLFFPQWKVEESLPKWVPGMDPTVIDWSKLTIVDVYKNTANFYPQIQFSQFNHSRDTIQKFFYSMLGGRMSTWSPKMFKVMDDTFAAAPANFRYFVAAGSEHCSMVRSRMYTEREDGVLMADWLRHVSLGEAVDNVKCQACSRMAEEGDDSAPPQIPPELLTGKAF